MMPIGFIGLGRMGGGMARQLLAKGHAVIGSDPNATAMAAFVAAGGRAAASPRDVANTAEIIFASLPTIAISEDVAFGCDGVVHGETARIYIETSTIGPSKVREIADILRTQRGIDVLDAPVSGGPKGADEGALTTIVAGSSTAFAEAQAYLDCMAAKVTYVGEQPGLGQVYKIVNNYIVMNSMATTCEAIAIGLQCGADEETLLDVLNHSTGRNFATSFYFPMVIKPRAKISSLHMAAKDVRLFCDLAERVGQPSIAGRNILESWEPAADRGQSMVDWYCRMIGETGQAAINQSVAADGAE